jgi:hypothetical protein
MLTKNEINLECMSLGTIVKVFEPDGHKRDHQVRTCQYDQCNKKFLKPIRFIKQDKKDFCSNKCNTASKKNGILVTCAFCDKQFEKTPSSLKNSRSNLYFCSRICKDTAQRVENGFTEIHPSHYNNGRYNYRQTAFRNYPQECSNCRFNSVLEVLDVHHIDEDRENNFLENLIILCPTCHTLLTRKHGYLNQGKVYLVGTKERFLPYPSMIDKK